MYRHLKAFSVLVSGQTLTAIIPLVTAPILGRLYSPEEYGSIISIMALAAMPSVAVTLQFHQGILIETDPREEAAVVWLSLLTGIVTSSAALTILLLAIEFLPAGTVSRDWLFLLPLAMTQAGLAAIASSLANRPRHYSYLSFSQALPAVATAGISILLGLRGFTDYGLMLGYAGGLALQIIVNGLYLTYRMRGRARGVPTFHSIMVAKRRHIRFALFSMPSEMLLTFTANMPIYVLNLFGYGAAIGHFGRARQIASIPPSVAIGAAGQIFRREALAALESTGDCRKMVSRTGVLLFLLGCLGAAPVWVFTRDIFVFYLGPAWGQAGEYAQILIPMLVLRMAVSPVSSVFWLVGAQRAEFVLSVLSVLIIFIGLWIGYREVGTAKAMVIGYSVAYGVVYIITFVASLYLAKKKPAENSGLA